MTWNYAYTARIWPSFLTTLLMLILAIYANRRRNIPGVLPFMISNLFASAWMVGSVMEFAAVDPSTKIFWIKFQAVWQLPAATAVTCFVLEYAWPGRWLTRRNLALLSAAPLAILGMVLSNDLNHLMWRGFEVNGVVAAQLGLGGWLAIAYSFGLVILSLTVFIWLFIHSPQHRWPVALMILGHIGFRTVFMLEKVNLISPGLPLDEIGVGVMVLLYFAALFGFHIFDPIPLARQSVIGQLRDGMLVLDSQGRVASLNPAAELILNAQLKSIRGKPVGDLLPMVPELNAPLLGATSLCRPVELNTGLDGETRSYELELSPLRDFRGFPVGHMALLHDMTDQRRAQAQIVEQQRSLATLQEREHLARELHDELSQDLALINLQAQLVSSLLEAGKEDQAQAQLQILAKAAREAHVDVRGEISILSHSIIQEKGFLGALKQSMVAFQHAYGIETELVVHESGQLIAFAPTVEVQLLRIVQEAFTNIRKHARARHARVTLQKEPACIKLIIEDDGVGFDPENLPSARQTFGLGIMSTRAEEVNGWMEIESAAGKGTRLIVAVPVNGDR